MTKEIIREKVSNGQQAEEKFLLQKSKGVGPADHHSRTSPMYSLLGNQDVVLIPIDDHKEIDEAELHGFRRTVAEIQWLLLVLVLLCMKLPGMVIEQPMNLIVSMAVFAGYVVLLIIYAVFMRRNGGSWP